MAIIYLGDNQYDDPNLALAVDEVLARDNNDATYIQFYSIIPPSLILAYRQHPIDINQKVIGRRGIIVARRVTSGGAIYCDSNGLLYSIIQPDINPQKTFIVQTARVISRITGRDIYKFDNHSLFVGNSYGSIIAGSTRKKFNRNYLCQGMLTIGPWDTEILEAIVPRDQLDMVSNLPHIKTDRNSLRDALIEEWTGGKFRCVSNSEYRYIMSRAETLMTEKYSTGDWIHRARYNGNGAKLERGLGFCYFASLRYKGEIEIFVKNSELEEG